MDFGKRKCHSVGGGSPLPAQQRHLVLMLSLICVFPLWIQRAGRQGVHAPPPSPLSPGLGNLIRKPILHPAVHSNLFQTNFPRDSGSLECLVSKVLAGTSRSCARSAADPSLQEFTAASCLIVMEPQSPPLPGSLAHTASISYSTPSQLRSAVSGQPPAPLQRLSSPRVTSTEGLTGVL